MSLCTINGSGKLRAILSAAASLLVVIPAAGQYPGQVSKDKKDIPELRSIAVLEWEGDLGKPKASRLVPVAVIGRRMSYSGNPCSLESIASRPSCR